MSFSILMLHISIIYVVLIKSSYPNEMSHCVGLHCLLRFKQSSVAKIDHNFIILRWFLTFKHSKYMFKLMEKKIW